MPVERPTFSESWYRVAKLRPRLRATVQTHRQHFRGQLWYVVQDPASNQFFRINSAGYHFIGMLDGRRTVADVWKACNEHLGDAAPTQGEVIQLLGQLYMGNLLQAELPPDTESLFRRYRRRRTREVQSYLTSLLFARIPLFDPDHLLNRWVRLLGPLFSWWGLVLWAVVVAAGLYYLLPRWGEFIAMTGREQNFLAPERLPLLYLGFVIAKIFHEFGHAFACKTFGRRTGSGGEVHTMGIMFLVFTPLPYVDASSAWAFRSKWQRVLVGSGGMLVELAIAAVAAIVWANTNPTWTIHILAHNIIFVAGISTLLFNANPLLRFDGYYILSDVLEIPNLAQRSRQYLQYLVKRFIWTVKRARSSAHTPGEGRWFAFYGLASTAYRIFIFIRILLFLGDRLPKELAVVALAMGVVSGATWALVPLGKLVHYLATSGELARSRGRAVASVVAVAVVLVAMLAVVPMPDRVWLTGVVEPVRLSVIHAGADGFLLRSLADGASVAPGDRPLVNAWEGPEDRERLRWRANPDLVAEERRLRWEVRILDTQRAWALADGRTAEAQGFDEQRRATADQLSRVGRDLANLSLSPPTSGTWLAWDLDRRYGSYVRRGEPIGMIVSLDDVMIRATAGQDVAGILIEEVAAGGSLDAEIRLKGRPGDAVMKTVIRPEDIRPAGQKQLPSAALGYAAGGDTAIDTSDRSGTVAAREFFEVRVRPPRTLLSGQLVVLRVDTASKPLVAQWLRSLLQLIQRRSAN